MKGKLILLFTSMLIILGSLCFIPKTEVVRADETKQFYISNNENQYLVNEETFDNWTDALGFIESERLDENNNVIDAELYFGSSTSFFVVMQSINLNYGNYKIMGFVKRNFSDGNLINISTSGSVDIFNCIIDGGAIWSGNINDTLKRGTENNGISSNGYEIHISCGTLNINKCTLQNHCSTNSKQPNLYVANSSIVNISDSILKDNQSKNNGATIVAEANSYITLSKCQFFGNMCVNNGENLYGGSAIYNLGTATLNDCIIENNQAMWYGGAIYNGTNGNLTIKGGTISSTNNCTTYSVDGVKYSKGNGIYYAYHSTGTGKITLSGNAKIYADIYISSSSSGVDKRIFLTENFDGEVYLDIANLVVNDEIIKPITSILQENLNNIYLKSGAIILKDGSGIFCGNKTTSSIIYVDSILGCDEDCGDIDAPIKTLERAKQLISTNGTIVLLNTYLLTNNLYIDFNELFFGDVKIVNNSNSTMFNLSSFSLYLYDVTINSENYVFDDSANVHKSTNTNIINTALQNYRICQNVEQFNLFQQNNEANFELVNYSKSLVTLLEIINSKRLNAELKYEDCSIYCDNLEITEDISLAYGNIEMLGNITTVNKIIIDQANINCNVIINTSKTIVISNSTVSCYGEIIGSTNDYLFEITQSNVICNNTISNTNNGINANNSTITLRNCVFDTGNIGIFLNNSTFNIVDNTAINSNVDIYTKNSLLSLINVSNIYNVYCDNQTLNNQILVSNDASALDFIKSSNPNFDFRLNSTNIEIRKCVDLVFDLDGGTCVNGDLPTKYVSGDKFEIQNILNLISKKHFKTSQLLYLKSGNYLTFNGVVEDLESTLYFKISYDELYKNYSYIVQMDGDNYNCYGCYSNSETKYLLNDIATNNFDDIMELINEDRLLNYATLTFDNVVAISNISIYGADILVTGNISTSGDLLINCNAEVALSFRSNDGSIKIMNYEYLFYNCNLICSSRACIYIDNSNVSFGSNVLLSSNVAEINTNVGITLLNNIQMVAEIEFYFNDENEVNVVNNFAYQDITITNSDYTYIAQNNILTAYKNLIVTLNVNNDLEQTKEYNLYYGATYPSFSEIMYKGYLLDKIIYNDSVINEGDTLKCQSSHTINAIWQIIEYSINYNLFGGELSQSIITSYNVQSNFTLVDDVYRLGFDFVGWKCNDEFKSSICAGEIGNIELDAVWEIKCPYLQSIDNVNLVYNSIMGTEVEFDQNSEISYSYNWQYKRNLNDEFVSINHNDSAIEFSSVLDSGYYCVIVYAQCEGYLEKSKQSNIFSVNIMPQKINITWENDEFVCNGKNQMPNYWCDDFSESILDITCQISNEFGKIVEAYSSAGNYVIKANSNNINYELNNAIKQFTIKADTLSNQSSSVEALVWCETGLKPDLTFVINQNQDTSELNEILGGSNIKAVYNISLIDSQNIEIQPDDAITIKLKIDKNLMNKNIKLLHIVDGKIENVEYEILDDFIVFKVNHLSTFVIVEKESNTSTLVISGIVIIIIIILIVPIIFRRKSRECISHH